MDGSSITMLTTVDTDIHVVSGDTDLVRMKVERNTWLVTVDGRYVKSDKVVSVWTPTDDDLEGFKELFDE